MADYARDVHAANEKRPVCYAHLREVNKPRSRTKKKPMNVSAAVLLRWLLLHLSREKARRTRSELIGVDKTVSGIGETIGLETDSFEFARRRAHVSGEQLFRKDTEKPVIASAREKQRRI